MTRTVPVRGWGSALEAALLMQIRAAGLPEPVAQYRFAPPRRWRFDIAWPDRLLAVEVNGGGWTRGRHSREGGMTADAEKLNTAQLRGWRVLIATHTSIESGEALRMVELAIGGRE